MIEHTKKLVEDNLATGGGYEHNAECGLSLQSRMEFVPSTYWILKSTWTRTAGLQDHGSSMSTAEDVTEIFLKDQFPIQNQMESMYGLTSFLRGVLFAISVSNSYVVQASVSLAKPQIRIMHNVVDSLMVNAEI